MSAPLISETGRYLLNQLIGQALVEETVCHRLLNHDEALIEEFGLSKPLWNVISTIQANSLQEFCVALLIIEDKYCKLSKVSEARNGKTTKKTR
ncbi:MAG: hypothetical protein AAFY41_07260 [Bacteroidota bacterium]